MQNIETINAFGTKNAIRVFNDTVEIIVTTEIGLNVLHFGFIGEKNEFLDNPKSYIPLSGCEGREQEQVAGLYKNGFAPIPPVRVEKEEKIIRLTQATDRGTQREIDIPTSIVNNHVRIVQRHYNRTLWPMEVSTWALTYMAPGGKSIMPLPPRIPQKDGPPLPTGSIALWCFCDLTDPRLIQGKKYLILKHDPNTPDSYKLGLHNSEGWAAYYNKGHLFVTTFEYQKDAEYPYSNSSTISESGRSIFLEVSTPFITLQPNEAVEQTQNWYLFKDVPEPQNDTDIDMYLLPLIKGINPSK